MLFPAYTQLHQHPLKLDFHSPKYDPLDQLSHCSHKGEATENFWWSNTPLPAFIKPQNKNGARVPGARNLE